MRENLRRASGLVDGDDAAPVAAPGNPSVSSGSTGSVEGPGSLSGSASGAALVSRRGAASGKVGDADSVADSASSPVNVPDGRTAVTSRTGVVTLSGISLTGQGGIELFIDAESVSVGAAEGNDLVLHDPGVSRRHFRIERHDNGWLLRDLDSTNGTYVNRTRVREAFLKSGTEICVGRTALTFSAVSDMAGGPSGRQAFGGAVGTSPAMREIFGLLERVAPTEATVLIEGETGCGKEVFARGIHSESRRARGPFVVFDCGATPRELIESILFGHERGAFTGAVTAREGLFEQAHGGTLFLDELGELPVDLQPKLLRILESREVRRVGASKSTKVDVRLVAATNRRLESEVAAGRFRADLFFRLAVIRINLPPVRERPEDIPVLVDHYLERIARTPRAGGASRPANDGLTGPTFDAIDRGHPAVSEAAMSVLTAWKWPGNVRELFNALERAVSLCPGDTIEIQDLPPYVVEAVMPATKRASDDETVPMTRGILKFADAKEECINRFEREYLKALMDKCENNLTVAAKCADVDRKHLRNLLKKHELYQAKDEA